MAAPTDPVITDADAKALNEIADALIQKGADGVAYGARYYQSLPVAADGKRQVRIYMQPYEREINLVNRNVWYELVDTAPVEPQMQQWILEEYNREFPTMHFEVVTDPTQANMFMVEGRFVPNPRSGHERAASDYYKTAANSMNAHVGDHQAMLVHLNTVGNPWFRQLIDAGKAPEVRATILNEIFNGFAVSDFQDLTTANLSQATQEWLAAHRGAIDNYTITRSGGPRDDEYLKPLDRMLVERLFHTR